MFELSKILEVLSIAPCAALMIALVAILQINKRISTMGQFIGVTEPAVITPASTIDEDWLSIDESWSSVDELWTIDDESSFPEAYIIFY